MRILIASIVALALVGCSSPQKIQLNPQIMLSESVAAQQPTGSKIALELTDARSDKIIGSHPAIDGGSAELSLSREELRLLKAQLVLALESQGYQVADDAPRAITFSLTKLAYTMGDRLVAPEVTVSTHLEMTLSGDTTYRRKWQTQNSKVFVSFPSASDNQALINQVVAATFQRAFEDPQVIAALSPGAGRVPAPKRTRHASASENVSDAPSESDGWFDDLLPLNQN